jgi:hypothetical protein
MKIEKNFDILVEFFETEHNVPISGHFTSVPGKVISWLHEAGHALQWLENCPTLAFKKIDMDEKPVEFMMGQFINENDAWDRGYELGKEWGLFDGVITEKQWNKVKQECLLSYYSLTPLQ